MPHSHTWLSENQVVYVVFSGIMSSDDIGEAFHESARYVIESSEAPVHFLHNWQSLESFPTSLSQVVKVSQNTKAPLKKVGWIVAYGKHSRSFEFMGNIFFQLFNVRFKLVKTLDDALTFLCLHDQRLDKDVLASTYENVIAQHQNTLDTVQTSD
ncbi:MAG: hypothetical protein AAFV93_17640 [Chloroflexota bacterium]